ncbi:MAG: ATP-grasp domain-containing protein [Blastocatellia bacterium]|nr:ATP-grasp domain-containing protein [Blastocatellia bacterium]
MTTRPQTILCLASLFSGADFMRECARLGHRVFLLTKEKTLEAEWPREILADLLALPNTCDTNLYFEAASHIARQERFTRVVALHEFDVLTAAQIREHLHLPGPSVSHTRFVRDKLAMRLAAREAGIRVPDFVHVLNYQDVAQFLRYVPGPWMLKPRFSAGGIGIRKLQQPDEVWAAIKELEQSELLHERPSFYLLEGYVPGEVYHVDSLLKGRDILFSSVSRYGRPPFDVYHGGGVHTSITVQRGSEEEEKLLTDNQKIISVLKLSDTVAHAEFIKSRADGQFYFLEIAARVGGAHTADSVEAASGINLWKEWAKIEVESPDQPYRFPAARQDYAGIILSLARQEWPDTAAFADPEIFLRIKKKYHVGFVLRSERQERILELLESYVERIHIDYGAVAPPVERPEEL